MKLWLVFVLFGEVAAAWGPIPGGRANCEMFAERMISEIARGVRNGPDVSIEGRIVESDDVEAYCIFAERKPEKGTPLSSDATPAVQTLR